MVVSKPLSQIKAYAQRRGLPIIPINAKDVSLLSEPSLFYNSILDGIKSSQQRIAISALYIGAGQKEDAIIQAICNNVQGNKDLRVNIVLDANRATRVDNIGRSSVTAIDKILPNGNVNLKLFQASERESFVGKLLGKIQKWNEISSTYHSKMLIFDNDIIITGANLSTIYFEKRQDRYMLIRRCRLLSNYMSDLLARISKDGSISLRDRVRYHNDGYIQQMKREQIEESDSYIIPLIQHGSSNLRDKEDFLEHLDSILPRGTQVYMSSGYFNPSSSMSSLKIDSVLAPSERANGFYEGAGLLKYVPRLYSALFKQYLDTHKRCKLFLYDKLGWSFHAKGIWVESLDDIYIHLIGSSNFNCRSSDRDFETQLVLLTRNRDLIAKLQTERLTLWQDSSQVDAGSIVGTNYFHGIIARVVKSFL